MLASWISKFALFERARLYSFHGPKILVYEHFMFLDIVFLQLLWFVEAIWFPPFFFPWLGLLGWKFSVEYVSAALLDADFGTLISRENVVWLLFGSTIVRKRWFTNPGLVGVKRPILKKDMYVHTDFSLNSTL